MPSSQYQTVTIPAIFSWECETPITVRSESGHELRGLLEERIPQFKMGLEDEEFGFHGMTPRAIGSSVYRSFCSGADESVTEARFCDVSINAEVRETQEAQETNEILRVSCASATLRSCEPRLRLCGR